MKEILRNVLKNKLVWMALETPFNTLHRFYHFLEKSRNWTPELAEASKRHEQIRLANEKEQCRRDVEFRRKWDLLFPGNVVKNGPFKGMVYNAPYSICSSFYPKLMGCYEKELWDIIYDACCTEYSAIIDVGCAEGYYAIGFAFTRPNAKIYAYDINQTAIDFCASMAEANGVEVKFGECFEQGTVLQLDLGEKAFFILDCEGYEVELIDREFVSQMAKHDFLIEVHEMNRNVGLLGKLIEAFDGTHRVEIIKTVADIDKVHEYRFPELEVFDSVDRLKILTEDRPSPMRWIFAHSLVAEEQV
jgi:2-polyprenyl-3-methyl-5-hydroxy-6-metoxy-1,4-benzoquinol methylase